jgi:hypothetical protein
MRHPGQRARVSKVFHHVPHPGAQIHRSEDRGRYSHCGQKIVTLQPPETNFHVAGGTAWKCRARCSKLTENPVTSAAPERGSAPGEARWVSGMRRLCGGALELGYEPVEEVLAIE